MTLENVKGNFFTTEIKYQNDNVLTATVNLTFSRSSDDWEDFFNE